MDSGTSRVCSFLEVPLNELGELFLTCLSQLQLFLTETFFISFSTFLSRSAANLFCFTEKWKLQTKGESSLFQLQQIYLHPDFLKIFFLSTSEEEMSVLLLKTLFTTWDRGPLTKGPPAPLRKFLHQFSHCFLSASLHNDSPLLLYTAICISHKHLTEHV